MIGSFEKIAYLSRIESSSIAVRSRTLTYKTETGLYFEDLSLASALGAK
jgi:hypothetical protein